ncbi:alkaline phosphatase, partial [Mycolicibacterium elephantis]
MTNSARAVAAATMAALVVAGCSTGQDEPGETRTPRAASPIDFNLPDAQRYHRLATYPVYLNKAANDPVEKETVAEIST